MLERQQRIHRPAALAQQLLKDDQAVAQLVHFERLAELAELLAEFGARVDAQQDLAEGPAEQRHQQPALMAQHAQRLLHRHPGVEDDAQQRHEGGQFGQQAPLAPRRQPDQQPLGQQRAEPRRQQAGDQRRSGRLAGEGLRQQRQYHQHERSEQLDEQEQRPLLGASPAHAIEHDARFAPAVQVALRQDAAGEALQEGIAES
ncbi:hypothetical protein D3C76_929150 [compost metagenome]